MKIEYTPERRRGFVRPGETEKQQNWGFSGITKSAQLPERLCERLTCCTKNKYEHWNYINCVKKRHNCRITGKKNATYDGRKNMIYMLITLCIDNDATFLAGWQICHQGGQQRHDLIFLGQFLRKSSRANLFGLASCSWSGISSISLNFFSTCLSSMDNAISRNSSLFIVYSCKEMRRSSSHHGADSDYSDSLAFRRCSYFNLRPQASKTHAEKLALGLVNFSCSTLASIPSISSCGNRIFFFADLLFVLPLDIDAPHLNGLYGRTQYSKKNEMLSIDMCAHMILICAHSLSFVTQIKQRPAVLATHAGRLTTNDSESIEVAMRNHTTHPQGRDSHDLNKYIWRFIALSTAQPRVITIEATSEQEARQQSPAGCVMVFAARIRQGSHHA